MSTSVLREEEKARRAERAGSVWGSVAGAAPEPDRIQTLQEKSHSAVYRLCGAAPGGGNVIAKWLREGPCAVEQVVYEKLLPGLALPVLRSFGSVRDEREGYRWLFVREAEGLVYDPADASHRATAARWLAALHSSAAELARALGEKGELPRVGVGEALGRAAGAADRVAGFIDNPALAPEEREMLSVVVGQCRSAAAWRDSCESRCRTYPHTLAHCDFVGKNFRVRRGGGGDELLVFDWEMAGYGPPAADLAECADLASYAGALRGPMAGVPHREIQMLCLIGRLMRWCAAVDWASWGLEGRFVHKSVRHFRCYLQDMCEISGEFLKAGLVA